jgi:hypothetical protein
MPSRLKQYLNRSILVSIPALFEDGKCRAHTLRSIETDGLWLSSDELTARLLPELEVEKTAGPKQPVFVPAAQIAAVILPPPAAPTAQPGDAAATPAGAETATATPRRTKAAAAQATPPAGSTATRQK